MFELSVLNGFKTVGTFILYKNALAFMIGPDNTKEKLGIMRLGGHIEKNESLLQALKREIKEEASVEVNLLNSSCTYYKKSWDDSNYYDITEEIEWDIKPLIITGDKSYSTAVFISYTEEKLKPSSEASGIIFLKEKEINEICSKRLRLKDFIDNGGKIIQQKEIDYNMEMYAGVHLTFLYKLIQDKNDLVCRYLKGIL